MWVVGNATPPQASNPKESAMPHKEEGNATCPPKVNAARLPNAAVDRIAQFLEQQTLEEQRPSAAPAAVLTTRASSSLEHKASAEPTPTGVASLRADLCSELGLEQIDHGTSLIEHADDLEMAIW